MSKYSSPYLAGVGLGLVLLVSFLLMGHGLGASGALMRGVIAIEKAVAPTHVNSNAYLAKYGAGEKRPLDNWIVFEIIGVFVGAMLSGALAGRLKKESNHGPRITSKQRYIFATMGGVFFGFGARLARGCTSGMALSGGATLSVGAWITMFAIFGGAYATAYFVRKLWI